jgi:hypothetical protein
MQQSPRESSSVFVRQRVNHLSFGCADSRAVEVPPEEPRAMLKRANEWQKIGEDDELITMY